MESTCIPPGPCSSLEAIPKQPNWESIQSQQKNRSGRGRDVSWDWR